MNERCSLEIVRTETHVSGSSPREPGRVSNLRQAREGARKGEGRTGPLVRTGAAAGVCKDLCPGKSPELDCVRTEVRF